MSSVSRRILLAVLLTPLVLVPAAAPRANANPQAVAFIDTLVNKALHVLAQQNMTEQQREQHFSTLFKRNFDIPRIARFVLGRYWRTASPSERQKFIDTYREFIIRSYASRFSGYGGETVKVTGTRPETADIIVVNSEIVHPNGDPPIRVSWRVRKGPDGFKIIDVAVEGVSMMLAQREEFASVIERNGGTVAGLTKAIQHKLQSNMSSTGG